MSEGLLSDDTERTAKQLRLMNSLFLGLSDLCQAFHTNTATPATTHSIRSLSLYSSDLWHDALGGGLYPL